MPTFAEKLRARVDAADSVLCVGLDPDPARFPDAYRNRPVADAFRDFCTAAIDATAEHAACFKPNAAFFEAAGPDGWRALADVIRHAKRVAPVILDAKRGDIGNTADAYARAAFDALGADAITVNPYMGHDSVTPFLTRPDHGAFVLCRTSNPGAKDFEERALDDGAPLWEHVAARIRDWGAAAHANAGLVVGATAPEALARVRAIVGADPWILVPGVGAQGGDAEAAVKGAGPNVLVNASRGILYAGDASPAAQEQAARALKDELNRYR